MEVRLRLEETVETPAQKRERELRNLVIGSLVYRRIRDGTVPPEWTPREVPERPVASERVVYNSDMVTAKRTDASYARPPLYRL